MSSLGSISEDCTFGVEREDLPPSVPRRRGSANESVVSTAASQAVDSLESINEEVPQSLHVEDGPLENLSSQPKRSRSSHSRSSRSRSGGRRSSKSTRREIGNENTEEDTSSSQRRSGRRSSSGRTEGAPTPEEILEASQQSRRSSGSSSRHRSRSRSSSDDNGVALSQEEEKIAENSRRRSSRNSRRSSSSSGTESEGQAVVAQTHRSSRHQRGSSRTSRNSQSNSAVSFSISDHSDSTNLSRRALDRMDQEHQVHDGETNGPLETVRSADEGSDEETPGAYRISMHSRSRISSLASSVRSIMSVSTHSGQSFATESEALTVSTRSSTSRASSNRSLPTGAVVRAEVAPDRASEIEAARNRGRVEAMTEVRNRDASIVVAVAQPSRSSKGKPKRSRRKVCFLFAVLLLLIGCPVAYFALRGSIESQEDSVAVNDGESELVASVTFDPPSPEDCESIANGTAVLNQAEMFTHYVEMQIDLVSASEGDASLLVTELMKQIQLIIMPLLVGCERYSESGNIIGNGIVDSNSTTTCISQQNPNCVGVVVTLKLYLREEDDGTVVVETISEILMEEDLSNTLGLPPSVQTASISLIMPKNVTDSPTDQPSSFPSMRIVDDLVASPAPSLEPTPPLSSEPTLGPTPGPTSSPAAGPTPIPTPGPTPESTPESTLAPSPVPTLGPSISPTQGPSNHPSPSPVPTPGPSSSLTQGPSNYPSPGPTRMPTLHPTGVPSTLPSRSPTFTPSMVPSTVPTPEPSTRPSFSPSSAPTDLPSSNPTAMAAQYYAVCGRTNFCNDYNGTSIVLDREAELDLIDRELVVRCCSDVPYDNMVIRPEGIGCPYITTNVGGSCKRGRNWEDANRICHEHNARLCTREEMEMGCGYSTGCNANAMYIWSSTRA